MRPDPGRLLLDPRSLQDHLPAATFALGLDIYRRQQVLAYTLEPASSTEWRIEGEVQGSERTPCATTVTVELDADGRIVLFGGDCSCAVARNCRHAAALALKAAYKSVAMRQTAAPPAPVRTPTVHAQPGLLFFAPAARAAPAEAAALPAPDADAEDAAPPPPEPARDTAPRPPAPPAGPPPPDRWLDLFGTMAEPPAQAATVDRHVYLLHLQRPAHGSGAASRLALSWGMSHPMKRGGWTQVKTPYSHPGYLPGRSAARPTTDDQECVRLIAALKRHGYGSGLGWVQGRAGLLALQRAAGTGRLFAADAAGQIAGAPLRWGAPRAIAWQWQETTGAGDTEPVWTLHPRIDGTPGTVWLADGPPPLYLDTALGCCGPAEAPGVDAEHLPLLFAVAPIPQSALADAQAAEIARRAGLPLPAAVGAPETVRGVAPVGHLRLSAVPVAERATLGPLRAALAFDYGGLRHYWPHHQRCVLVVDGSRRVLLDRQLAAEMEIRRGLLALGLRDDGQGGHHLLPAGLPAPSPWLDWALCDYAPLREAGFVLEIDAGLHGFVQQADTLDLRIAPADGAPLLLLGGDPAGTAGGAAPSPWFDLSLGIEIDGVRENVLPWLPALLAQLGPTADGADLPEWLWRPRPDGGFVRLPSAPLRPWLQALLDLVGERRPQDLEALLLRLSRTEALRLAAAMGEGAATWRGAEPLRGLLGTLGGQGQLPAVPVPAGLRATLRPYQHHGLQWLQFLRAQGLAGILADDMGLGKTLQTLAHLLAEQEAGRLDRPCLVVAPVSLLGNWQREAARFAPTLRTRVWHGTGRRTAGATGGFGRCDLVIAPYSLLQRDRERWQAQPWHLVVLDEAQNIRNASTQAAQVAAGLDTRHRLCLTGTPLENHLGELWSLFHFLMPGFLGSAARFKETFRTPIEKHGDAERLDQLRRRVTPFLLRRGKSEVADELPAKQESTVRIALGGAQADLYETIRLATEKAVRDALTDKGLAKSQIQILDALLKLRQVCCDPRLLAASVPAAQAVRQSAKLELLMAQLTDMLAEGRRVLVFSQFTTMLGLIEAELKQRRMAWTTLTGQTTDRDRAIARFTGGEVPLFLISLKAGGTGLNLPQADTVIHYDPWWNPAAEAQATGRAHRIGQTQRVMVYRLVAEGTIEERILALQERKAALADSLYSGAAARREPLFTESDVAELLRPLDG